MTLELEQSAIHRTLSQLSEVRKRLTTAQLDLISAKVNGNSDSWDGVLLQTADDIAALQKRLEQIEDPLWRTLRLPQVQPADPGAGTTQPLPAGAGLPVLTGPSPTSNTPPPSQVMNSQFLIRFAQNMRIGISSTPISQREWELRHLTISITENWGDLRQLFKTISNRLSAGALKVEFRPSSSREAAQAAHTIRQLQVEGFVSDLLIQQFPDPISFEITGIPELQRWLQGRWLEVAAYLIAKDEMARRKMGAANLQLHSGLTIQHVALHREIDLVGQLPNSELFWAECKSGQWQQFVGRAKEIRGLLGTPVSHSLLIVPSISQRDWDEYRSGPYDFLLLKPTGYRKWLRDHLT